MDYLTAKNAAINGALILRPDWFNPLRWNGKRLEFVTAVLTTSTYSRRYSVSKIDASATDWVLV